MFPSVVALVRVLEGRKSRVPSEHKRSENESVTTASEFF